MAQSHRLIKKNMQKILDRIEVMPLISISEHKPTATVVEMNIKISKTNVFIPLPVDNSKVYAGNFTAADLELL